MLKEIFNDRLHLCFVSIVQEHPGLPHGQHGLQDLSMELALQQTLHADLCTGPQAAILPNRCVCREVVKVQILAV